MSKTLVRALTEPEARTVFTSLDHPALDRLGPPLLGRRYATLAEGGAYRPEWTFVAEREGRVVARAALYAAPQDQHPVLLDWFDLAPGEHDAAVRLLTALPFPVPYELLLPPGWRTDPLVHAAAEARLAACAAAGREFVVERFRYEWTPRDGLPPRTGGLVLAPPADDESVLGALREIHRDTRDAHARRAVAAGGIEHAARDELEFFDWLDSARRWWQLAYTPHGELAGLHVPGRNPGGFAVGFIGVLPEHRGRGYSAELLAACTARMAAEGAERIAAATDIGNTRMAKTFARSGYRIVQHLCVLAEPGQVPD
ncbi:GNAT family N-acetyltransferase [Streptomyces xiaopingdaonensis]|uniref:GNAT family N-acetyltransferase n=1 Tax=Streptomyces xiaopingdaonensis TaxID=1565415 RepID=UPI0002DF93DD|nr:GNAT family N-acetyltransferase [Streptomyces xiaopingdaonensis]